MSASPYPGDEDAELLQSFCAAAALDLELLARLHAAEPDAAMLASLQTDGFPAGLGLRLTGEAGVDALARMAAALAAIPKPADATVLDGLAVDYADIYLTHALRASPCESVWFDDENLACQESMFQVRRWYTRHGLAAADWRTRPDDHLVLQLQFLAHLCERATGVDELREVTRFMDEHLLRWLPRFAGRVAERCSTRYFAALALLTQAWCEELRDVLEVLLDEPRPDPDEIDEKMRGRTSVAVEFDAQYLPGAAPSW